VARGEANTGRESRRTVAPSRCRRPRERRRVVGLYLPGGSLRDTIIRGWVCFPGPRKKVIASSFGGTVKAVLKR